MASRARRPPTARTKRAGSPAPASIPAERVVRVELREDPHAHIVCRQCGRIQGIELTELDKHLLGELAERHPDGWMVDGIAFSVTGACRRCREGPAA